MLVDLNAKQIETLISGLSWKITETNCPENHIEEYNLISRLQKIHETKGYDKDLFSTKLDDFGVFKKRMLIALNLEEIFYFGDLASIPKSELNYITGIGSTSKKIIISFIDEMGILMGKYYPSWRYDRKKIQDLKLENIKRR